MKDNTMKDTMNNTTHDTTKDAIQILALIPHRDAMQEMQQAKKDLFCEGLYGVFSFPFVAPLAILKRPLKFDELKTIAKDLRTQTLTKNGRFTGELQETIPLFDDYSAYGVRLSVSAANIAPESVPQIEEDARLHRFEKVILTQALIKTEKTEDRKEQSAESKENAASLIFSTIRKLFGSKKNLQNEKPSPGPHSPLPSILNPAVSFRSAFVANVMLRSLGMPYSFEWTIVTPVWLPKWDTNGTV
jgi:hypothetical protein